MAELNNTQTREDWIIDRTAISPYQGYCDGFSSPGATGLGYVSGLKVAAGTAPSTGDPVLDGIVAFDAAEISGTYLGQINMIETSSFSGLAGQVWGYDLARHDDIDTMDYFYSYSQFDFSPMYCYDVTPLLEATDALFGTVDTPRYPLVPGAFTVCASKNASAYRPPQGQELKDGEAYGVWSMIGLAIAKDRENKADLLLMDAGLWRTVDHEQNLINYLLESRPSIAAAIGQYGARSRTVFEKAFIGYSYVMMQPDHVGVAIAVGPYGTLAKDAIPSAGFDELRTMKLSEWIREHPVG